MAQTNTFNTRIQHKHDVEANWLKATTFAPKAGELIIYDVDGTHSSPRFKVGDGTTLITDLPFSSAQSSEVGKALLKTGDTMEGVLKFTEGVHYGEEVPAEGEEGQIFFQLGESLVDTLDDGSIGLSKLSEDVTERLNYLDGVTVNIQTQFNARDTLGVRTSIPANADLNNYVTIGCYACSQSVNAKTVINKPLNENDAFTLNVRNRVGSQYTTTPTSAAYVYFEQEYISMNGSRWYRSVTYNNSTTPTFGNWTRILDGTCIQSSTTDLTAGTSSLTSGQIYLVYE